MPEFDLFTYVIPYLLQGVPATIQMSLFGFLLGFFLGIPFGLGRMSGDRSLSFISSAYVDALRGTPLLVQILLVYFGLPSLGLSFDPITAGIVAIGINSGAYQAEIVRAGIQSIPKENLESAESLGLSDFQVIYHVVMPLALRNILPSLTNELITLIKESSLVSVIGVAELTRRGEYVMAWTFMPLEVYLLVAAIYFVICFIISKASARLEKKLSIPGYISKR